MARMRDAAPLIGARGGCEGGACAGAAFREGDDVDVESEVEGEVGGGDGDGDGVGSGRGSFLCDEKRRKGIAARGNKRNLFMRQRSTGSAAAWAAAGSG